MKLGNYDFQPRTGPVAYAQDYSADGCKQMSGNRIRLTVVKNSAGAWQSAGLLGPILGFGQYTMEFTGRLDALDPNLVMAAWQYSDQTQDEVDFLEATRWGDINNPNNLYLTTWKAGVKTPNPGAVFPARAFNRYRAQGLVLPKSVSLRLYGQLPNKDWKEVASHFAGLQGQYGQMRFGLWLPKSGFTYPSDSLARGPLYVTLDKFEWVAATPDQLAI